jgi:protoporphyrinogen oxidase
MEIAIIGAGITGLTLGYRLSEKGHKVTIFEKDSFAGGLASGFKEKNWSWSLEKNYHHLFTSDQAIKTLLTELNLSSKLFFEEPKTSIYYQNQITQFDSPVSLLKFPFLNPFEKIQTGMATLLLKFLPFWQFLEKYPAVESLPILYGEKAYKILWEPLLEAKFGDKMNEVSMAWFWARIHKRSAKLGYLEGGFQALIDELVSQIKKNEGQIIFNQEINSIKELESKFEKIIVTTPSSVFLKMAEDLPLDYQKKLQGQEMLGNINIILSLNKPFFTDNTYWLNVNDKGFPFVAVVEHTNFVDKKYYGDENLLYLGGYYPQIHKYFKMSKEDLLKEFLPYLQKINPKFDQSSIINHQSFFSLYAQPIIPINYSLINLPLLTPIPNVYLANMEQVYPWDRQVNYAIEKANEAARLILQ